MKMAVLGITREVEEQVEKTKQAILVVISDSEESRKVFDAAVQMAKESDGKIILTAMIDEDIKPPFEFKNYVLNEKINADPNYVYKTMFAEQLLRPFEETLRREGIEYDKVIELENSMKRIAALANNICPARIVIGIEELRKATRGVFRGQKKYMENLPCPLTIIP
jgi:nucleotide-binding universal stress UspA family protein